MNVLKSGSKENIRLENVCRTCSTVIESDKLVPIFKADPSNNTASMELIEEFAFMNLQISHNDGLPQQICNECLNQLKNITIFRRQCERSQSDLRAYFKVGSSIEGVGRRGVVITRFEIQEIEERPPIKPEQEVQEGLSPVFGNDGLQQKENEIVSNRNSFSQDTSLDNSFAGYTSQEDDCKEEHLDDSNYVEDYETLVKEEVIIDSDSVSFNHCDTSNDADNIVPIAKDTSKKVCVCVLTLMPRNRHRTTTKGKWCKQDLKHAEEDVKKGMSMRAAAKKYKIPFSTFQGRLKKGKMNNPSMGRKPIFTKEQEDEIAAQITFLASTFYGLTMIDLRKLVFKYAKLNKVRNNFNQKTQMAGVDWLRNFLQRNPTIVLRRTDTTKINRAGAFNTREVTGFYDKLSEVMAEHNFTPNNIYNAGETDLTTTDSKETSTKEDEEHEKIITVMCAMNAAGSFVPPMFIFPKEKMIPLLQKGGPPGALYKDSKTGWITADLFVDWLKHFTTYTKPCNDSPVLLIIGNDVCHISLAAFNHCKEHHIAMLLVPPNSSNQLQPLNVAFYGPLKAAFRDECNLFIKSHTTTKIEPQDVASLFNKAYSNVANKNKGEFGFRVTGIYPLNPNIFNQPDFVTASTMAGNLSDATSNQLQDVVGADNKSNSTSTTGASKCESPKVDLVSVSLSQQQETPFGDITPFPSLTSVKLNKGNKRQHATILTVKPMEDGVEEIK